MKIPPPSKRSAAASGVALGLAAPVLDLLQQAQSLTPHMREALFISVISLLIFIPATFFVVGIEYWTQNIGNNGRNGRKGQGPVAIDKNIIARVFCWFAGGTVAFAAFSTLQGLLRV